MGAIGYADGYQFYGYLLSDCSILHYCSNIVCFKAPLEIRVMIYFPPRLRSRSNLSSILLTILQVQQAATLEQVYQECCSWTSKHPRLNMGTDLGAAILM